ncbi:MAG: rod-binding protein [Pseudobdellovibrionaceae bacterium]
MKIQNYKNLRQPPTPEEHNQKLKDVSQLYEKQFLREMMKQMRATVSDEGGMIPTSNAEKIFREQLDHEYVEKWGDRGGIGLADMIHQQLLEKLGPALGITQRPVRPQGPIQIDEKSLQMNPLKLHQPKDSPTSQTGKTTIQYDLQKAALESPDVSSPWKGSLLGVKQLNQDEQLVELLHDNGLKSQLVFRGQLEKNLQAAQLKPGAEIQAGQRLGLLSPEAKSFFWTVDVADSL